jgi:hypothetical protein
LVPMPVIVTVWLPLTGTAPVQLPDAVQPVASIVDQVSVVEPPTGTAGAVSDITGTMNDVSAWTKPYPESKFGDDVLIGNALPRNAWYICAGVSAGLACSISAAMLATCGVAAEVPKKFG